MKRVLICGDREWTDYGIFSKALAKFEDKHGPIEVIIEGCARGADAMAGHRWALANSNVRVEHYPAMWNHHNSYSGTCWCTDKSTDKCKGAGPLRNQAMLDAKPNAVIAFHANLEASKGTKDMVARARKAGIPVWVAVTQPQTDMGL